MKLKMDNDYSHISSFEQLKQERTRLSYEVRLNRKKLDLSLMELSDIFSPVRLFTAVAREWIRPVSESIRYWLQDFIRGRSRREH